MEWFYVLQKTIVGGLSGQFGQGALVLWLLGVLTYVLREVPTAIGRFIKRQFTMSIQINNSGDYPESSYYEAFFHWFNSNQRWLNYSRSLSVSRAETSTFCKDSGVGFSAGVGMHFFVYKRRMFWFNIQAMDSSGTERVKLKLTITGLIRSRTRLHELFAEISRLIHTTVPEYKHLSTNRAGSLMAYGGKIVPRRFDQIAINHDDLARLRAKIDWFVNNKEWYRTRGIPYKLAIVLYGPPGTGKSSIARAISTEYKKDIITPDFDETPSTAGVGIIDRIGSDILLLEDFESFDFTKTVEVAHGPTRGKFGISAFLNLLDGCSNHDGCIILMTTNNLDDIDPRILRGGRTDILLKVDSLSPVLVHEYFQKMYPEYGEAPELTPKRHIRGCELHEIAMANLSDPTQFIRQVNSL